ncbi:MAG: hypothetical protein ACRD4W_05950 [Nitrososphaeraceae archaeon]
MPSKIPETLRWAVIEKWMLGFPRSAIVTECGISAGAVSSIVDQWRYAVGLDMANLIRDLGVTLRKLGMSPAQCASGLRIVNLADKIGMDVHLIETFLCEVYERMLDLGVNSRHIVRYAQGLLLLLDNENSSQERIAISLDEIDSYFEKRKQEKNRLDEEIKLHESKLGSVKQDIHQSERALEISFEEKRKLETDVRWKLLLQEQLEKNGLAFDDIPKFVEGMRVFKDQGFHAIETVKTFSSYNEKQREIVMQMQTLAMLRQSSSEIEQNNQAEEKLLEERRLKNSELEAIKRMGFGLFELKRLHYLMNEIAEESGAPTEQNAAVKKFFDDLEDNYGEYVDLGKKVYERRIELRNLAESQNLMAAVLNLSPEVLNMTQSLIKAGITKTDIVRITKMIIEAHLSQPKKTAEENSLPTENGSRSEYSDSKSEDQGDVGPVTLSGTESILRKDDGRRSRQMDEKSQEAPCNTDDKNIVELFASFSQKYGNRASHQDGVEVYIPQTLTLPLEQSDKSKIRIRPPSPPSIAALKARLRAKQNNIPKKLKKTEQDLP